jgi:hypothetical protein
MWKNILNNINALILANWKSLFMFVLGALAGVFLLSCSMINTAVDATQEALTEAVEYVTGSDEEAEAPTEE